MLSGSYRLPIIISVLLHLVLVIMVTLGWSSASDEPRVFKPRYVDAKLYELKPKTIKQASPGKKKPVKEDVQPQVRELEQQKSSALAKQKADAKQKEEAKQKAEAQQKAAAKKKAEAEAKKKADAQKAADAKKKAEAEAKKSAEAKKKADALKKAQAERNAKEAEEKRRQQEIASALAEEEALLTAEVSDAVAQSYIAMIVDRIGRNWSRPPSARRGMICELRIQLIPTGEVVSVVVTKSSGNSAFDRSAEQAVRKAERFPELQKLDSADFDRNFRQINITFDPQDLRL